MPTVRAFHGFAHIIPLISCLVFTNVFPLRLPPHAATRHAQHTVFAAKGLFLHGVCAVAARARYRLVFSHGLVSPFPA